MLRSVYKHTPAVVGLLLLFAGIYKVVYPAEAMAAVVALDVPGHWADFAVVVVTILELYVGTIILLRVDLKWGLRMATALVLSFAAFLFFLATMAHPPSCGC